MLSIAPPWAIAMPDRLTSAAASASTAHALEHLEGADLADHAMRFVEIERRRAKHHVAEGLDEDAAEPEHHHRPEHWIAMHPEHGLDAVLDHRRDHEAVDFAAGPRGNALAHGGACLAHRRGGAEIERDAADVGLVHDVGRRNLEHDWKSDGRCSQLGLRGGVGQTGANDRHAGAAEERKGIEFGHRPGRERRLGSLDLRRQPASAPAARTAKVGSS